MFRQENNLSKRFYPLLKKWFGFNHKSQIIDINFNLPWWWVLWVQKYDILKYVVVDILYQTFVAVLPILIGLIIVNKKVEYFPLILLVWITLLVVSSFSKFYFIKIKSVTSGSLQYSAVKYFLTVDPISHSTRSSGQIIAKVNRAIDAYDLLIDNVSFELLIIIVKIVTVSVAVLSLDFTSGLVATFVLIISTAISILTKITLTKIVVPIAIKSDDKVKEISMESLRENYLIRSSFATPEQDEKVKQVGFEALKVDITTMYALVTGNYLVRIVYVLGAGIYGFLSLNLIQNGFNQTLVISVLLAFFSAGDTIFQTGRILERVLDRQAKVVDLYEYIRNFGKSTFPVLPLKDELNTNSFTTTIKSKLLN